MNKSIFKHILNENSLLNTKIIIQGMYVHVSGHQLQNQQGVHRAAGEGAVSKYGGTGNSILNFQN